MCLSLIQVLTTMTAEGGKEVRSPQDGPCGILLMPSNVESNTTNDHLG